MEAVEAPKIFIPEKIKKVASAPSSIEIKTSQRFSLPESNNIRIGSGLRIINGMETSSMIKESIKIKANGETLVNIF